MSTVAMYTQMAVPSCPSSGRRSPQRRRPCAQPRRKNNERVFWAVERAHQPSASSRKRRCLSASLYVCAGRAQCRRAPPAIKSICTVAATVDPSCAVARGRETALQIGLPRQRSLIRRFPRIHSTLCRLHQPHCSLVLVLWDACLVNCGIKEMAHLIA
jgi:hypothetical protein